MTKATTLKQAREKGKIDKPAADQEAAALPAAVIEALQPLEQFERTNTLAWQWRHRWRTSQEGGRWQAEVQAGYADDQWRPTGVCPRWGGSGVDQASALADAVSGAMHYWSIGRSGIRA